MSTETATAQTVTLAKTIYTVEVTATDTYLTGPRGAVYFLRGFLGADTGRRQVISAKSGQPLRVRGNEIRVIQFGDIIEQA